MNKLYMFCFERLLGCWKDVNLLEEINEMKFSWYVNGKGLLDLRFVMFLL